MTSNLRVAPLSPAQLREHSVPIGFASNPEEHEDFSQIGGVTHMRAPSSASRHANTTHILGETCVVVWSTSKKEASMLCGFGNYNNRWNRPGGISEDVWSGSTGVQPNRFRLRTVHAEAQNISREERVNTNSSRVVDYMGGGATYAEQYDPEVDNVETREQALLMEPVEITVRRFVHEANVGTQGTLGFAVLDLFVNNAGIMKYLEKNWDQLLKTREPFASHVRRTHIWILAKRDTDCQYGTSSYSRAVPFDDLVNLTARELGVPVRDVPLHIDLRALDVLSRYGPPANFPSPPGTIERDALETH